MQVRRGIIAKNICRTWNKKSDMHILIVDDFKETIAIWRAYARIQGLEGYEFATSGAEALQLWEQAINEGNSFDAVVLDLAMPDMTGTDVAGEIRAAGDRETRIIFCTAHGDEIYHLYCETVGTAAYLTKPILPQDLFSEIERVVSQSAV